MTDYLTDIEDIKQRIESDFGENAIEAFKIINTSIENTRYLNHPRIIRCIIFLADKNIDKLIKNINTAIQDPRDVMFWAEYINQTAEIPIRIRDFNKAFDSSDIIK